uniref:Cadherin domain-containing protein n=1 Tax=Seriola lalandi dorsalis TaxID=1841481 RepID=A0A3B4X9Z1_SERLL
MVPLIGRPRLKFSKAEYQAEVSEIESVGTSLLTLSAVDPDEGPNGRIRYSLKGGEGRFSVDPVSGVVSVAGALDRETKAEYNLQVVAEDQGRPARSSTATLLVQVSDINDNIPEFSKAEYQAEVSEIESVGMSLLTLSAVDPDEGPNGRVTFSIFQQSPSSDPAVFGLDPASGTLQLVQPLDYSEVQEYRLMVQFCVFSPHVSLCRYFCVWSCRVWICDCKPLPAPVILQNYYYYYYCCY